MTDSQSRYRRSGALGLVAGAAAGACLFSAAVAVAIDRDAVTVDDADAMRAACRDAATEGPRSLHVVTLGHWAFAPESGAYDDFLPVDTRRNLRVFDGAVELLPSGLEAIGFFASRDRADELRAVAGRGGQLRIGFFLGFDNHHGTLCLVRPGYAVVRMDVAFVELVDAEGRVVARDDTERLRAWLDDVERDGVPGDGPRGRFGSASLAAGPGAVPADWQRALAGANGGAGARALARCHREGVDRGAVGDGQVVLRLTVDGRSGRVTEASVSLSSIGDDEEASCIAETARRAIRFPGRPVGQVALSVPVRLAD